MTCCSPAAIAAISYRLSQTSVCTFLRQFLSQLMCGIALIITSSNVPPLPDWPFWRGSSRQDVEKSTTTPTLDELLPLLQRRGPDATYQYSVNISSEVKIRAAGTNLLMRNTALLENKSGKRVSESILLYNGEIYEDGCGSNLGSFPSDSEFLHHMLDRDLRNDEENILHKLDALRGPWTFAYWSSTRKKLYFGRDLLGRRSLLIQVVPGSHMVITSVPPTDAKQRYYEIPPVGVGFIDFNDTKSLVIGLYRRMTHSVQPSRLLSCTEDTLVAGSVANMYVSFLPLSWLRSKRMEVGLNQQCYQHGDLMSTMESTKRFIKLMGQSVRRRLITNQISGPDTPRFALLFSGGIDSMVLARILDEEMPIGEPLHLINVAFGDSTEALDNCPDRGTAITGIQELRRLSTRRRAIDLICVDVSSLEAQLTLESHVKALIHPCDQPMDKTIGTAVWLASQATGKFYGSEYKRITSSARILFSGLGADELMGGYKGRHRTVYRKEGLSGVCREMDADLSRLWFRNLGRDDRLVADHGRELRHPFLDEDVINFVTKLPLTNHVCDLSLPDGVGDKLLLRRAGALLGLSEATTSRIKRAIQFGSRSKQVIERKRNTSN